jgi:vacuolar-type H+-ATPase subunit I/STV1
MTALNASSSSPLAIQMHPSTGKPCPSSTTVKKSSLRQLKASCRRLFQQGDTNISSSSGSNTGTHYAKSEPEEATSFSLDGNSTEDDIVPTMERVEDVQQFLCEINEYVEDLAEDKEPLPRQIEAYRRMAVARYGTKTPTPATMVSLRRMYQLKVSLARIAQLQGSLIERFVELSDDLEWARKESQRDGQESLVCIAADLDSQRAEVAEWERAAQAWHPIFQTDEDLLHDFYESLLEDADGRKLLNKWFHPSK